MPTAWDAIDHLIALDPGGRGIAAFFTPGAALAAARALVDARRVLITTGFTVAAGQPETDGPPGAAVLGRALRRIGARVRYVTDPPNVPVLEAALKVLEEPTEIAVYPDGDGVAAGVLARERPTHMVAVERPGRAPGGDYLNARGASVAEWNRRIDELFLVNAGLAGESGAGLAGARAGRGVGGARARGGAGDVAGTASGGPATGGGVRRGRRRVAGVSGEGAATEGGRLRAVTVGVGDGGNEIGMGNVRARLLRQSPLMAQIASIVPVDHLVVAGTSNWGAYGVAAALGRFTGRQLVHTPEIERRLLTACVHAGAVDGVSRRREATVDNLPLDVHAAVVELLALAATQGVPGLAGADESGPAARARGRRRR